MLINGEHSQVFTSPMLIKAGTGTVGGSSSSVVVEWRSSELPPISGTSLHCEWQFVIAENWLNTIVPLLCSRGPRFCTGPIVSAIILRQSRSVIWSPMAIIELWCDLVSRQARELLSSRGAVTGGTATIPWLLIFARLLSSNDILSNWCQLPGNCM